MSFLIWHTLAFAASMIVAFAAGYQSAKTKQDQHDLT